MALPLLPVVGIALMLFGKKKQLAKKAPPTNPVTSGLLKAVPYAKQTSVMSILPSVAGLAGTILSIALSIGGPVAAAIAAIVIIVVVDAIIIIWGAVTDAQWVHDSGAKGQAGLEDDYVTYGVGLANGWVAALLDHGLPAAQSKAWAAVFGAACVRAYNEVQASCVDGIPWGNALVGWAGHRAYWAARAMMLQDGTRILPRIMSGVGASVAAVSALTSEDRAHAETLGRQLGRIYWAWLYSRSSMIEPWHASWVSKANWGGVFNWGWGWGSDLSATTGYRPVIAGIILMWAVSNHATSAFPNVYWQWREHQDDPWVTDVIIATRGSIFNLSAKPGEKDTLGVSLVNPSGGELRIVCAPFALNVTKSDETNIVIEALETSPLNPTITDWTRPAFKGFFGGGC